MRIAVLDLETSEKPILHPFQKGAYLSTIGLQMFLSPTNQYYKEWVYYHSEKDVTEAEQLQILFEVQDHLDLLGADDYLVGHNVKFDINWMKSKNVTVDHCKIWDTQLVEYMLSGQDKAELPITSQDLSNCCRRHGLPVKTDVVKTYWDAGKHTKDIPLKVLLPYQKNDVLITADLFKAQYKQVIKSKAFLTLVGVRNKVIHSMSDIELNGMPFDRKLAESHVTDFSRDLELTEFELKSYFGRDDINLGSGPELSACLFGGMLKRVEYVPFLYTRKAKIKEPYKFTYKSGKKAGMTVTKYRNREVQELCCKKRKREYEIKHRGTGFLPPKGSETLKTGVYQTNKNVLPLLKANTKNKKRILHLLMHRSKIAKFTETFVGVKEGTGLFALADLSIDGSLHPNYNQTIAATGRQTSSNPNGQNFPRSKADEDGFSNPLKQCFVPSRPGGMILVADLSQLEWRIAAWLSQDPVAMAEIINGVDCHADNAIRFFGDIKYRQDAKIMTFRLLYGGSAYAFYMDPKMPNFSKARWNEIVKQYENKYHVLIAWQRRNIQEVAQNKGYMYSPLGRVYKIPQEEHRKYPGTWVYKETCIKNYMVQGTATADVMPLAQNELRDRMALRPHDFVSSNLMGQVHDSVIFDTMPRETKKLAFTCIQVFEDLPVIISDMWGVDFNLPMTGEVTVGPNYGDQIAEVCHEGGKWITKGDWDAVS